MPQRRISDDSVRHGCSVNDLTVPFPCAGQMVDLRLPFVLVPGNIGLAIVNETRPAAFELLAPLWWLDAIKDRTEPWSAIVHDRGTVQHLQGARVLPKDFGSTRSICSVIVVYETAAGDMVSKVHGESPVEPSKPFVDGARIEVVAEPFAIHRIFNAAFHLGTHCVVHDDSGRSRVAETALMLVILKRSSLCCRSSAELNPNGWSCEDSPPYFASPSLYVPAYRRLDSSFPITSFVFDGDAKCVHARPRV